MTSTVPLRLIDLPDDVLVLIAAYLVPPFDQAGEELEHRLKEYNAKCDSMPLFKQFPDAAWSRSSAYGPVRKQDKISLASLASFNRTCRKIHRLTNSLLWETITLSDEFNWKAVRARVDPLVRTVWYYNDTITPSNDKPPLDIALALADRFPSARIASIFPETTSSSTLSRTIAHLHLIVPDKKSAPWSWSSLREPPRGVKHVRARLASVDTQIPQFARQYRVKEWRMQCRKEEKQLVFPDIFKLPISAPGGKIAITWGCTDDRDADTLMRSLVKDIQRLSVPRPNDLLQWESVQIRVSVSLLPEHQGVKPSPDVGSQLSSALPPLAFHRAPRTSLKFDAFDKSNGKSLWPVFLCPSAGLPRMDGGTLNMTLRPEDAAEMLRFKAEADKREKEAGRR